MSEYAIRPFVLVYSTKINVTILDKISLRCNPFHLFLFSRIILRWYYLLYSTCTFLHNNWHNMCSVTSLLSALQIPQEFSLKLTYITYSSILCISLQTIACNIYIYISLASLICFKLSFLLFVQIRNKY